MTAMQGGEKLQGYTDPIVMVLADLNGILYTVRNKTACFSGADAEKMVADD